MAYDLLFSPTMHWIAVSSRTQAAPAALIYLGLCVVATACGGSAEGSDATAPPTAGTTGTKSTGTGAANATGTTSTTGAAGGGLGVGGASANGGALTTMVSTSGSVSTNGGALTTTLSTSSGVSATGGALTTKLSTSGGVSSTGGALTTIASTSGGVSSTGGTLTKSSAFNGGTSSLAGASNKTATGGTSSLAGASSGTTIAAAGSNGGGTSGCSYTPPRTCSKNSQCSVGQFCDTDTCDSPCSCVGSSIVCTNACVHQCKVGTCTAPTSGFVQRIHDSYPSNVVARVNASATEILGYQVVPGAWTDVSRATLDATIATWSSPIDWTKASVYADSAALAYYYVYPTDAGGNYAGAAFSGSTGENLFLYTSWTDPDVPGIWLPASDLNGSCDVWSDKIPHPLGPWDPASDPGEAVMDLLNRHGFNAGISTALMGTGWEVTGCSSYVILRANSNPVEYVVIAHPSPCV